MKEVLRKCYNDEESFLETAKETYENTSWFDIKRKLYLRKVVQKSEFSLNVYRTLYHRSVFHEKGLL